MFAQDIYDPGEFEISTRRGSHDVRLTIDVDFDEADFLAQIVNANYFQYRDIEDVIRHAIFRHTGYLSDLTGTSPHRLWSSSPMNALRDPREEFTDRNFCLIIEFVFGCSLHHGPRSDVSRALVEALRDRARFLSSKRWREIYEAEIDQVFSFLGTIDARPNRQRVSLKPSTFSDWE